MPNYFVIVICQGKKDGVMICYPIFLFNVSPAFYLMTTFLPSMM